MGMTIITCVHLLYFRVTNFLIAFACIYILHLVPVLFGIVIPTSFNIFLTLVIYTATHEPTSLSATSKSNSTHVNILVTWKSPQRSAPMTPLNGYVIYYQPKGGAVNSVNVSKKEAEKYLLEGLQRGRTYNISILAWSIIEIGLLSPLVGPITVISGIYLRDIANVFIF